jgi:Putative lumazine-binding
MTTSATSAETAGPRTDTDDEKAIREVVQRYYVGLRDANLSSLGEAFDDLAVVCGYIGTDLYVKHVKTLYDFVVENEPPSKTGDHFRCEVKSIEVNGGTAVVTLAEHDYLGVDYTTSLHLVRGEQDAWAIVSKLFDGKPKPGSASRT